MGDLSRVLQGIVQKIGFLGNNFDEPWLKRER
jgi:hypothetical protein